MIELLVVLVVGTFFSAGCLWMGMKLTNVDGTFSIVLGIAAASTALSLIPLIGWLLGAIAMFALICALTDANFWPDAILMVLVAKAIAFFTGMFLSAMLA